MAAISSDASPPSARWAAPVFVALFCGLALRVVLVFVTPIGGGSVPGSLSSYNDEIAHANYILHIVEHGSLPGQVESIQGVGALARGSYENYQPPLYYLLVAGAARVLGFQNVNGVVLTARLFGILICGCIVWVFLQISAALNADLQVTAVGVMFIALNGVFVRFTSTAGNDPLFWLLAGAMILVSMRILRDGLRPSHWMTFAALACLSIYTKLTAILLLPLPLVLLAKEWNARRAVSLAAMYCLVLVCAFPLWLRNLYDFGSLLPLNAGFGEPAWRIPNVATAVYAVRSFIFPWSELWHRLIEFLLLVPICILGLWSLLFRAGWRRVKSQPVILAALLITVASYLWLNSRYDQAEGRYFFTAWPALTLALIGQPRTATTLWLWLAALLLPYSLMIIPPVGI